MADNPQIESASLDQSEIDKLLAQEVVETTTQKPLVLRADGLRDGLLDAKLKIERHDFRNTAFLTEAELRRLRLLHELHAERARMAFGRA